MAQNNETRLRRDLQVFLQEYLSVSNNSSQLLRFDFFTRKPDRWHLSILAAREGKHCLMNARGEILGCYDEITPLFCIPRDSKIQATVEDLQDQLLCLRSKAPREPLLAMTHELQTLCSPFRSLSAAYLVREQELYGVIDPLGAVIISPQYRSIEPFPFRERFGAQGDCHSPVPGGLYGETGLYLCRGDLHRLNTTDVYDLKGNLIFRDITDIYSREEMWVTPKRITESTAALLSREKQVRSIWVSRQEPEQPFPGAPELQSILDRCVHYSLRRLSGQVAEDGLWLHSLDNAVPWVWDVGSILADGTMKKSPRILGELLMPPAEVIGSHIGCPAEAVLDRLGDYSEFFRERNEIRLDDLTPETGLQSLGLTAQACNCLVRNGIITVGDLLAFREDRLPLLRRSTPQAIREITSLQARLKKHFDE